MLKYLFVFDLQSIVYPWFLQLDILVLSYFWVLTSLLVLLCSGLEIALYTTWLSRHFKGCSLIVCLVMSSTSVGVYGPLPFFVGFFCFGPGWSLSTLLVSLRCDVLSLLINCADLVTSPTLQSRHFKGCCVSSCVTC